MLTKEKVKALKAKLLKKQSEMIMQLKKTSMEAATDAVGELSSYDNHPADMGTELYEREKDMMFRKNKELALEAVNKALHAIDDGTYGICRVCSMPIPYERLEAMPSTDTCVEHADSPAIMLGKEEIRGTDGLDAWVFLEQYGTSSEDSRSD